MICAFVATTWAGEIISVPSLGVATISQAMINARNNDTIYVSDGVYNEKIFIKSGVALIARNQFKAIIDGGGKGTVVTLGTVGYGDVHAIGQLARVVTMVQVAFDLVVIGALIAVASSRFQVVSSRPKNPGTPPALPSA